MQAPAPGQRLLEEPCAFDGDYVRRLVEGDACVEDHFIRHFGELMSIKLRARVRSREMIEDVRQDTFLRVLKVLREKGGLEHPERLGAFVNSVCRNVLFEKFREEGRYAAMSPESDDWPDRRVEPDAPLINQEHKRLVERVLGKLSGRDQDLLRMIFLEEVDRAEACERLGVTEGYLRVMLHRATSRFREELLKQPAGATQSFMPLNQSDAVKRKQCPVHYTMGYSDGT